MSNKIIQRRSTQLKTQIMQLGKESKVVMRVKEIITQDKFYFKTLEQFFSPHYQNRKWEFTF